MNNGIISLLQGIFELEKLTFITLLEVLVVLMNKDDIKMNKIKSSSIINF